MSMCKHKKTILLATLITSFLLACQVWAHNPGSDSARGVMAELAIVNGPDMNRAGYGWLNSSSEVGAETFFHDLCPQRGGGTFSAALCAQQQDLVASGLGNSLAWPAIESSFMLMTQAKIYEHAIMEAAAMGKPIPNVPSCLTGSTQATAMKAFVDANKDKDESDLVGEIQTLGTALKNKTSANPAADQEKMNQLIKMILLEPLNHQ